MNQFTKKQYTFHTQPQEPYQINCTCVSSGRHARNSKRRIQWIFGFANQDALAARRQGADCRGEEYDVVLLWSFMSGVRRLIVNGEMIHREVSRSKHYYHGFRLDGGQFVEVQGKCVWKEGSIDLKFSGKSFHDFKEIYELGADNDITQSNCVSSKELVEIMRAKYDSIVAEKFEANEIKNANSDLSKKVESSETGMKEAYVTKESAGKIAIASTTAQVQDNRLLKTRGNTIMNVQNNGKTDDQLMKARENTIMNIENNGKTEVLDNVFYEEHQKVSNEAQSKIVSKERNNVSSGAHINLLDKADNKIASGAQIELLDEADYKVSSGAQIKVSAEADYKLSSGEQINLSDIADKASSGEQINLSDIADNKLSSEAQIKLSSEADHIVSSGAHIKLLPEADHKVASGAQAEMSDETQNKVSIEEHQEAPKALHQEQNPVSNKADTHAKNNDSKITSKEVRIETKFLKEKHKKDKLVISEKDSLSIVKLLTPTSDKVVVLEHQTPTVRELHGTIPVVHPVEIAIPDNAPTPPTVPPNFPIIEEPWEVLLEHNAAPCDRRYFNYYQNKDCLFYPAEVIATTQTQFAPSLPLTSFHSPTTIGPLICTPISSNVPLDQLHQNPAIQINYTVSCLAPANTKSTNPPQHTPKLSPLTISPSQDHGAHRRNWAGSSRVAPASKR